jgi:hypothetical protein
MLFISSYWYRIFLMESDLYDIKQFNLDEILIEYWTFFIFIPHPLVYLPNDYSGLKLSFIFVMCLICN